MYKPVLLAGVDTNNNLTLAKFGSTYSGPVSTVLINTVLCYGLNSSGLPVVLRVSGSGELV